VIPLATKKGHNGRKTGVGHLRRPKNAMYEGEDVLCCFLRRVWVFRDVATTGWFALGRGNFGSQTPRAALPARLVLGLTFDALTLNTIQSDCSSVVNSFCPRSTCHLLHPGFSLIKCRSGGNSHSSMSCSSKMPMTLPRVRIYCASRLQSQLSRLRHMD